MSFFPSRSGPLRLRDPMDAETACARHIWLHKEPSARAW